MLRACRIACLLVVAFGCSDRGARDQVAGENGPPPANIADKADDPRGEETKVDSLPPEIQKHAAEVAERQSQGLKAATTIVHRAFEYRDKSRIQPNDDAKLVAVDVEFRKYDKGFDLDDVDILDGDTNENFGSDPEIKFLNSDGTLSADEPDFDDPTQPIRLLLIYAMPKQAKSIKLEYWSDRIVAKAAPITQGSLKYDESRLISGIEFWPYPGPSRLRDTWHRGRWLLAELSIGDGASVVDLGVWPPAYRHWDCNVLQQIEAAPQRGWVMLTRTGSTRDDIRFPVWVHPEARPGASPLAASATGPRGHLRGIGVLGDRVFAHDDEYFYWFADGKLQREESLGEAQGVPGSSSTRYTHGTIALADGRELLLWDGDGYEFVEGRFKKTWPLGINEPYEFATIPWGQDGFYFLENRKVYRIKPDAMREQVMTGVENVMAFEPGPEGGICFRLGDNKRGIAAGLWFPSDDTYATLQTREISATSSSHDLGGFHWSAEKHRFYVTAVNGIYTIPEAALLARPRTKHSSQAK